MNKLAINFYIITVIFVNFIVATDISIIPAIRGQYEAEKYLQSKYLVTNLHLSKKDGRRPLLLILGGSSGGFPYPYGDTKIKMFLDSGYHVLEVAYFSEGKIDGLPDKLSKIRLESFWEEIEKYLTSEKIAPFIDNDLIGVMGTSKGGELALLLGSLYPQFKFVIGIVPSHVAFQGSNTTLYHYSSWTFQGNEVPFVPFPNFSIATIYGVLTRIFFKPDNVNFTWMHTQALKNTEAVEKAVIKVENINGPVLLISGIHDQWLPSLEMSRLVVNRLKANNFPHPHMHLECDTDHFPFMRKPEVFDTMLDEIDKMVEYRRILTRGTR